MSDVVWMGEVVGCVEGVKRGRGHGSCVSFQCREEDENENDLSSSLRTTIQEGSPRRQEPLHSAGACP
eukprot:CAMPEP_0116824354 /NCGR_PEP_ID=MMETSP0418-20121206/1347_1 /TAXON_ID=1158023 /ORGANISM="Astrosyne radiata, Strain 13vi08-1A" /LENGTH=67 /DNA_ID=CAMNT_0004452709 /DNA_START=67 /DNA_END=270 /DNA_ORIENTATION=+